MVSFQDLKCLFISLLFPALNGSKNKRRPTHVIPLLKTARYLLRSSREVVVRRTVVLWHLKHFLDMSFVWLYLTWLEAVSRCENQTSREIPIQACAVGLNSREIFSLSLRVQNRLVSARKVMQIRSIVVFALKWRVWKWFWRVEMLSVRLVKDDSASYIAAGNRKPTCLPRGTYRLSISPNEWRSVLQTMCLLSYASSDIMTAGVLIDSGFI